MEIVIPVLIILANLSFAIVYRTKNMGAIKIGAIVPMSGAASYTGKTIRDGMLVKSSLPKTFKRQSRFTTQPKHQIIPLIWSSWT